MYFANIKEAAEMGPCNALAMTKSLYPRIDIDTINGFADGTSEERALELINEAQNAAIKISEDVVDNFRQCSSPINSPVSSPNDGPDDE